MDDFMRWVCGLSHTPEYVKTDNGVIFDRAHLTTSIVPNKHNIERVNRFQHDVHVFAASREFLKQFKKELQHADELYSFDWMCHKIEPMRRRVCNRIAHQYGKPSLWCRFGIHRHKPVPESDVMVVCRCGHAKIDYKKCWS